MLFWRRKGKEPKDVEKEVVPATVEPRPEPPKKEVPKRAEAPEAAAVAKRKSPWGQAIPLEVKLLGLQALDAGLNPREVAELLGVWVGTVRDWKNLFDAGGVEALRKTASSPQVAKRCKEVEERILAYRKEHPAAGVRRVSDELRRTEEIEVGRETVRQVVNEAGLGNPPAEPRPREHGPRRFERPIPNAMWQIDIFTFNLKRLYPVYLVGIIDDHSRFIVGWGLFRQQTAEAVVEVLKGAIGQWGAPRELLSDNGRQFVAWQGKTRFQKVLTQQGVQHVRSAPHHPMTLGKIERFWKTIWTEYLEEAVFASYADASQRIGNWIDWYNHQRSHQGIDGATPAERFYGLAQDVEEMRKQGCKENALQLALGQAPKPPLYLMGRLGSTDVRVVRKGDELEVQIGDTVLERIRLGAPYRIEEEGGKEEAALGDTPVTDAPESVSLAESLVEALSGIAQEALQPAPSAPAPSSSPPANTPERTEQLAPRASRWYDWDEVPE